MSRHINAPRAAVYRALIDPLAIAKWKVPTGMTSQVHTFDARPGGAFRVSLTYDAAGGVGKTTARTDTYHGHFAELAAGERVVEVSEFETDDAAMRGEMTITITLADAAGGGTELVAVHDGVPTGVLPADNEEGWRQALEKLAALVEAGERERGAGAMSETTYSLHPIGVIRSPLQRRKNAPRQGSEGAPEASIEIDTRFAEALKGVAPGDDVIVITWLHEGRREVLQVYPRGDRSRGLFGVFATRSPDRPNPIGLHRVTVREIAGCTLKVGPIEAIDGTPVVDIKPVLAQLRDS